MNAARTYKSQTWKSIVIIFRRHFFIITIKLSYFEYKMSVTVAYVSIRRSGQPANQP